MERRMGRRLADLFSSSKCLRCRFEREISTSSYVSLMPGQLPHQKQRYSCKTFRKSPFYSPFRSPFCCLLIDHSSYLIVRVGLKACLNSILFECTNFFSLQTHLLYLIFFRCMLCMASFLYFVLLFLVPSPVLCSQFYFLSRLPSSPLQKNRAHSLSMFVADVVIDAFIMSPQSFFLRVVTLM